MTFRRARETILRYDYYQKISNWKIVYFYQKYIPEI